MSMAFRASDIMHWEGPGLYGLFLEGKDAWHWRKVMPNRPSSTDGDTMFKYCDANPLPVHNDDQDSEFGDPEKEQQ